MPLMAQFVGGPYDGNYEEVVGEIYNYLRPTSISEIYSTSAPKIPPVEPISIGTYKLERLDDGQFVYVHQHL